MQEFETLRDLAKERRDKAISIARCDYDATLESIADLESDLLGTDKPHTKQGRSRTTAAIILEVIPPDREFTTLELLTALEQREPNRKWSKAWIDNNLRLLRKRGLIRRLKRDGNRPSIYCKSDAPVPMRPFEGLRLNVSGRPNWASDGRFKLRHFWRRLPEYLDSLLDPWSESEGGSWRIICQWRRSMGL